MASTSLAACAVMVCLLGVAAAQLSPLSRVTSGSSASQGWGGGTMPDLVTLLSNPNKPVGPAGGMIGGGTSVGQGGGKTNSGFGTCTKREADTLFNNCLFSFGMVHLPFFPVFRMQRTCPANLFSCGAVNTLVKCVNAQPVNVISNRCWNNIKHTLSRTLQNYAIPCTYDDIYNVCWRFSAELLPLSKRPQRIARKFSNNPMPAILMQLHLSGNFGHVFGI